MKHYINQSIKLCSLTNPCDMDLESDPNSKHKNKIVQPAHNKSLKLLSKLIMKHLLNLTCKCYIYIYIFHYRYLSNTNELWIAQPNHNIHLMFNLWTFGKHRVHCLQAVMLQTFQFVLQKRCCVKNGFCGGKKWGRKWTQNMSSTHWSNFSRVANNLWLTKS